MALRFSPNRGAASLILATPARLLPRVITATGTVTIGYSDRIVAVKGSPAADTDFYLPPLSLKIGSVVIWDADGVFDAHTYRAFADGDDPLANQSYWPLTSKFGSTKFTPTPYGWLVS